MLHGLLLVLHDLLLRLLLHELLLGLLGAIRGVLLQGPFLLEHPRCLCIETGCCWAHSRCGLLWLRGRGWFVRHEGAHRGRGWRHLARQCTPWRAHKRRQAQARVPQRLVLCPELVLCGGHPGHLGRAVGRWVGSCPVSRLCGCVARRARALGQRPGAQLQPGDLLGLGACRAWHVAAAAGMHVDSKLDKWHVRRSRVGGGSKHRMPGSTMACHDVNGDAP